VSSIRVKYETPHQTSRVVARSDTDFGLTAQLHNPRQKIGTELKVDVPPVTIATQYLQATRGKDYVLQEAMHAGMYLRTVSKVLCKSHIYLECHPGVRRENVVKELHNRPVGGHLCTLSPADQIVGVAQSDIGMPGRQRKLSIIDVCMSEG